MTSRTTSLCVSALTRETKVGETQQARCCRFFGGANLDHARQMRDGMTVLHRAGFALLLEIGEFAGSERAVAARVTQVRFLIRSSARTRVALMGCTRPALIACCALEEFKLALAVRCCLALANMTLFDLVSV